MAGMIEITDRVEHSPGGPRILAAGLPQLLELVAPEGRELRWFLLELEAVGDLGPRESVQDLAQRIAQSPHGLPIDWDALVGLANRLFQVINGIIVGAREGQKIPPPDFEADIYTPAELVFEVIDSTLVRAYTRDDQVLRRLQATFHAMSVVQPPYHLDWY